MSDTVSQDCTVTKLRRELEELYEKYDLKCQEFNELYYEFCMMKEAIESRWELTHAD